MAESVPRMRGEMQQRILEESNIWKAERDKLKKERETNEDTKAGEVNANPQADDDSDSDIVIGEVVKKTEKTRAKGRKSGAPARLRG